MSYKAKATRRDDGGYDLSYGKGSKKLVGLIERDADGGWTASGHGFETADVETKREAIAAWESWAAAAYVGRQMLGESRAADQPVPSAAAPRAPQSLRQEFEELLHCFTERYDTDNATTLWMGHYIPIVKRIIDEYPEEHQASARGRRAGDLPQAQGKPLAVPPVPRRTKVAQPSEARSADVHPVRNGPPPHVPRHSRADPGVRRNDVEGDPERVPQA